MRPVAVFSEHETEVDEFGLGAPGLVAMAFVNKRLDSNIETCQFQT